VREFVVGELELLQRERVNGIRGFAASQASTCGRRTASELMFQVAICMGGL